MYLPSLMAFVNHSYILFVLISFISFIVFLHKYLNRKTILPTNWPVLGMVPAFLVNQRRLHDYANDILTSNGGTFMFKGPWFSKMDMLITTNPSDINHVLSKNFANYPKGRRFRAIFDALGDGIFTSDGELWQLHRKTTMSIFKHPGFRTLVERAISSNLEKGLLPVFESFSEQGKEMDLQDVFQRFFFDTNCKLVLDHDPKSLRVDLPRITCEKAMVDGAKAVFYRHILPVSFWKLQKRLGIGREKKLSDASKTLDRFLYEYLAEKRNKINNNHDELDQDENFKLFTAVAREFKDCGGTSGDPNKFLKDTLLTLITAGNDSTSAALTCFFYLIAKNPIVEDKIREEIQNWSQNFDAKELGKFVYLHGAFCESLRLFPAIPFNHKSPLTPDILPSGHKVDQNTKVILSFYSMGRMASIWGEDCMEFKPERWILPGGGIKHEPTYKFSAFNAGPRTCIGKDISLYQLKIVAATIIKNYHIDLVEGHPVIPGYAVTLQMRYGLKVKLTKISKI